LEGRGSSLPSLRGSLPRGETLPVVLFNYIRFDLDGAMAAASMVSSRLPTSRACARSLS
jgi:hypothetical protein